MEGLLEPNLQIPEAMHKTPLFRFPTAAAQYASQNLSIGPAIEPNAQPDSALDRSLS
jgi:hypothetical protein